MSGSSGGGPTDQFPESSGTLPAASSSAGPDTPASDAASALVTDDPNSDLLFYSQSAPDPLFDSDGGYDPQSGWSDGQPSSDPFTNAQTTADPWAPYYADPTQQVQPEPSPTNPFTGTGPTEPFSASSPPSDSSFQPATAEGTPPGAPTDLGTATVDGKTYHVYGQIMPDSPPVTTYTFPDDVITATPDPTPTATAPAPPGAASPAPDPTPTTHLTFPEDVLTATPDPVTPALPTAQPGPLPEATSDPTLAAAGLDWSLPPLPPASTLPALPPSSPLSPLPVTSPPVPPTAAPSEPGTEAWLKTQPAMSARDPSEPEIELPPGLQVARYLGGYITVLQWQGPDGQPQSYTVTKGMPATSDSDPLGTLGPNRNTGGSLGIIAAVMAGANPDQVKTAGEIGEDIADIGMAAAPVAVGLSRNLSRNPLEPTTEPELPRHPAEDFVNPDYMIDTSNLPGSSKTALGYTRNNRAFWREMLSQYPWLFSPTNTARINQGRAPWVDQQWLEYHPGQVLYEGDTLVHHHWDQGPMAFGIPEEFHRLFYPELHPFQE